METSTKDHYNNLKSMEKAYINLRREVISKAHFTKTIQLMVNLYIEMDRNILAV